MKRLDPLALAVLGGALLIGIVAAAYVVISVATAPPAPKAGLPVALENARKAVEEAIEQSRKPAPPPPKAQLPRPPVKQKAEATPKGGAPVVQPVKAGGVWSYRVTLEPPQWRDAHLDYRTVEMVNGIAVYTEFRHAAGKMNFQLGTFAANHPSHANVRFPGFFMYAAYLVGKPLEVGQRFVWEWPWQLSGGAVKAGRVKRYSGELKAWENVQTPSGTLLAARIEGKLAYIEDNVGRAMVSETLWYAPQAAQLVKVVREGKSPDEGATRIVAELVALK